MSAYQARRRRPDGWDGRTTIGLVAVTAAGRTGAARLAEAWPEETRTYEARAAESLPRAFAECDAVVAFLATGAAVRLLAPHLDGKDRDPGVVCVDEGWRFAVALLGGHPGGANHLADQVGRVLGCEPVVTTASEAAGGAALDAYGADLGFRVEEGSDLAAVGAAVLSGERVAFVSDRTWPLPALPANVAATPAPRPGVPTIVVTDRVPALPEEPRNTDPEPTVVYRPPSLVVGVGASSGVDAAEVLDLVDAVLNGAGLSALSVRHLATATLKSGEPGLVEAAARRGWRLISHPAPTLAEVVVPNPSEAVRAEVGTPSVAEAAAMYPAGAASISPERATAEPPDLGEAEPDPAAPGHADLLVTKRKSANATAAVARHHSRGRLALIGLGPGARDLLTPRAQTELRRASVLVGLDQYVDQVRDLLRPGTRVLASGLGAEEERARAAVGEARRGHAVALVGSGDAGVYAMAAPALELADGTFDVAGVPGVTAALTAASLLGAPLGHDHAAVSLSDLHTPWEVIERRVRAAAEADLVVAFYNPRSVKRDWQLPRALRILAEHRPPGTPVGFVSAAAHPMERVTVTALADADPDTADMTTLVVIGASTTRVIAGRMVTPRGYPWSGRPASESSGPGVRGDQEPAPAAPAAPTHGGGRS